MSQEQEKPKVGRPSTKAPLENETIVKNRDELLSSEGKAIQAQKDQNYLDEIEALELQLKAKQDEIERLELVEKEKAELKEKENALKNELAENFELPEGQYVNNEGIVMIKILFPNAQTAGGGFRGAEIPLELWEKVKTTQDKQGHPYYKDAKEA
jgi:hypothetical protein